MNLKKRLELKIMPFIISMDNRSRRAQDFARGLKVFNTEKNMLRMNVWIFMLLIIVLLNDLHYF